jgi:hypothetical protein
MAFALFRKSGPEPVAPALQAAAAQMLGTDWAAPEPDSAKEILELPIRVGGRHWGRLPHGLQALNSRPGI